MWQQQGLGQEALVWQQQGLGQGQGFGQETLVWQQVLGQVLVQGVLV